MKPPLGERYARWVQRRMAVIFVVWGLLVIGGAYLAKFHLPLDTDLASLLPPEAQSVVDMRRLEARVPAQDAVLTLVVAPTPALREQVAADVIAGYRELPETLVARLEVDDAASRAFFREHLGLFVPLDELVEARDELRERIEAEKLAANPLYIDLEDDEEAPDAGEGGLDRVRERWDDARARLEQSSFVSEDGTVQLIIMRTAFPKTDVGRAIATRDAMKRVREAALAKPGRDGVEVGFTGGIINTLVEHAGLVRSMTLSAAITGILVLLVLWMYYRSAIMVLVLSASLVAGVVVSFGFTALTIGHLNLATAFLVAIVAGNGVNFGLLLLARYSEERAERRREPFEAIAVAVGTTVKPTLVASMGAIIAYGSLAVTSFRGFSEFAVIGGVGMALCWISAFTVLPALVLLFDRRARVQSRGERLGRGLVAVFASRKPAVICALAAAIALASGAVAYDYVASDPFEYDARNLRSSSTHADASHDWKALSNKHFGREISGATYIAVERPEQVPLVLDALRAIDAEGTPREQRKIGTIRSIEDVIPRRQAEKLAVLQDIRALLDDDALATLDREDRELLDALRPPEDLDVITEAAVPGELLDKLRERDGRVGLLLAVRPGDSLEMWDGRDLMLFADLIREIRLADDSVVTTSGSSVVFADIIRAIRVDGPYATLVAGVGILLLVLAIVGANRFGLAVLTATVLGTLVMVAVVALIGIKVNFLDFVALPITLGLGVDYGVNIAHRGRRATADAPAEALRTSGAAVLTASATTIIAYGSLLISDNAGVRSFGVASLIGEVCCVIAAMALVPAIVGLGRRARELRA